MTSVLHDLLDHGRPPGEDQPLERDEPDQPARVVDDVGVVDRLAVGGLVAEPVEGLADGDVRREGDVVGGHHRAGGAGLVAGQACGCRRARPGPGCGRTSSTKSSSSRLTRSARSSCDISRSSSAAALRRHRLDQPVLAVEVEVAEDLGAVSGLQHAEEGVAVVVAQVLDQLGDAPGCWSADEFAQAPTSPSWISSRRSGTSSGFRIDPPPFSSHPRDATA